MLYIIFIYRYIALYLVLQVRGHADVLRALAPGPGVEER